ncbi:Tyrosine-protein kinase Btk29A [Operophtera brumata]|uniref:Tyrosine-protein kinase Btk29A n=1 Tax=Operophtera brumata TaxID=104452 RepID=A0A0L7KQE4_OPEBR|nr:Tyrosine-protein kinase Btk29A [Operophtera brumata]
MPAVGGTGRSLGDASSREHSPPLLCRCNHPQTKHYHIKLNARGEFYLSDKHCCSSIPDLINYHRHNSGGLCSRLKASPSDRPAPPTAGLSHGECLTLQHIHDLVNYHRHNSGGLCSRLKASPSDRPAPPTAGLSHDKWKIDKSELVLKEELGAGQFGVVRRGIWRGSIDTAVKMMKPDTMSQDDFIDEAKVMT